MIDKFLVKRRFKKSLPTYSDNAIVQKQMASKLIELLPLKEYSSVLEIGCATGVLTSQLCEKINYKNLDVNDLVPESKIYIDKIVPEYNFIAGDIEKTDLNKKYDLIISNACLQWCDDLNSVLIKLRRNLNQNGVIAVSLFGNDNLKELTDILDVPQKCYSSKELKQIFNDKKDVIVVENTVALTFDNPLDVLQHIKLTGANAVKEYKFTKSALKDFEKKYTELYSKDGKVSLTYNPLYLIVEV